MRGTTASRGPYLALAHDLLRVLYFFRVGAHHLFLEELLTLAILLLQVNL